MRPPGPLGTHGTGWEKWVAQYDMYMRATEKDTKSGAVQVATLLTLLGEDALEAYNTSKFDKEAHKNDITIVKTKFTGYYQPRRNTTYERYNFLKRRQAMGEPFDAFLQGLLTKIRTCQYHPEEKDNMVRDQIVMGLHQDTV